MFKKCFILLMALWSCPSALAVPHNPFEFYNDQAEKSPACEKRQIEDMPPARSQDSLPICFAMSSAVIAQHAICKKTPERCEKGRPKTTKDSVSPLSMLAWTRTNELNKGVHQLQNHKNLQFYGAGVGGATDALRNASSSFIFFSDSCFPFDQLANEFDRTNTEKMQSLISVIKTKYEKAFTEGGVCEECILEINKAAKELKVTSLGDIGKKIEDSKKNKENSGQFLHSLMLGGCKDGLITLKRSQMPKYDTFPREGEDGSYSGLIGKIKNVLDGGNPLSFDGLCIEYEANGKCKTGHSVAISGYRKVCKKTDDCGKKDVCRELLYVQNSWSPADNGWVDAKKLMSYATDDNKNIKETLSWYF